MIVGHVTGGMCLAAAPSSTTTPNTVATAKTAVLEIAIEDGAAATDKLPAPHSTAASDTALLGSVVAVALVV